MELHEFVDQCHGQQTKLAKSLGVDPQLVWQWARKARPVPISRCVPIEMATGGAVMRWRLRPDDWHLIWPELIGADGAPAIPAEQGA